MDVQPVLAKIAASFQDLPNIVGVVLGGSRARGTNRADSDIDISVYYDAAMEFDLAKINAIATSLDDSHREGIVTPPGAWGEWINAGGWLIVEGFHMDIILREFGRVEQVIGDCLEGKVTAHYQAAHPHAYLNAMYMGELAICKILYDREGRLQELKGKTTPYPAKMKKAIVEYFLFEAGFSLMFAEANAAKDDVYYVYGHLIRAVSCLNQVLFALNEQYCINEKKAVRMAAAFPLAPADYKEKVDVIFLDGQRDLLLSCTRLKSLLDEIRQLGMEF